MQMHLKNELSLSVSFYDGQVKDRKVRKEFVMHSSFSVILSVYRTSEAIHKIYISH